MDSKRAHVQGSVAATRTEPLPATAEPAQHAPGEGALGMTLASPSSEHCTEPWAVPHKGKADCSRELSEKSQQKTEEGGDAFMSGLKAFMEPFVGLHSKPEPLRPWGASAAGCWEGRHSSQQPARMLRDTQVDGHAADKPVRAGGRRGAALGRAGGAFSGRGCLPGQDTGAARLQHPRMAMMMTVEDPPNVSVVASGSS